MADLTTSEILGAYNDIQKMKERKRLILSQLLEEELRASDHIIVERTTMAGKDSYLGIASFRWINDNIGLASEMPFLKYKTDKKGKLVFDEESLQDMRQREPDYTREFPLVRYLLGNHQRKFPPITVVVVEKWVSDPDHENWDSEKRAKKTSMPLTALDPQRHFNLLLLGDHLLMYAADGQHRKIGIEALLQLIRLRKIHLKNKEGIERKGQSFTLEELMEEFGITESEIDQIDKETLGIEFIPAIIAGETYDEAKERVTNVFINVNRSAVQTNQAQEARIANDGFSKVARKIALSHDLFKRNQNGDRVNMETTSLPPGSVKITGLVTLVDMAKEYLRYDSRFLNWQPRHAGEVPMTPPNSEVELGIEQMRLLWDEMSRLPIFEYVRRGEPIDVKREFPSVKYSDAVGHLLLRPIGQLIMAKAGAHLHVDPNGPQLTLKEIFDKLITFDKKGGFDAAKPSSIFYGITYEPARQRMVMGEKGKDLAASLIEYMVDGASGDELNTLKERFREARTFKDVTDPDVVKYLNYNGEEVRYREDIELPPML